MRYIKLTQGKRAKVDDEEYDELVATSSWCAHKERRTFYAYGWKNKKVCKMHRIIMKISDPKIQIDHKDGNGLNNQKSNLRIATPSQNGQNRICSGVSKYVGVHASNLKYLSKSGEIVIYKGWKSEIRTKNGKIHIGRFKTQKEAALAYDKIAIKEHGKFARVNFKI